MPFMLHFLRGSFKVCEEFATLRDAVERARFLTRVGKGMHFTIRQNGAAVLSDYEMEMQLRDHR